MNDTLRRVLILFEVTTKGLDTMENYTYTMEILPDKDDYLDKECPNEKCLFKFKVFADDWKNIFSDEAVYCPFCGHNAPSKSWWTTEQIEQAKEQAIQNVQGVLGEALRADAKSFNRQNNKGFIKMSMKISGLSQAVNMPAQALEEMEQKIACKKCGARYAVIGSAFYCPCCGYNSAEQTFFNTIEKVDSKMKNLNIIRDTISQYSKDEAARTCISLLETSIPDLVVALQRLCECVYPQITSAKPLKRNVFQRLADGNDLWKDLVGKGYTDWISEDEYKMLIKCFQQRHILQHKDGLVDQDYITKSRDTSYLIGQHIVVNEKDILSYLRIVTTIGKEILALLN